jgi:hypothetical protein
MGHWAVIMLLVLELIWEEGGGEGVSASVVVSVSFGVTGLGTHVAEK